MATTLPIDRADIEPLPLGSVASGDPPAPADAESAPVDLSGLPADSILRTFHPAVAGWFLRRFPDGPTEPQRAAWPLIADGGTCWWPRPPAPGRR